MSDIFIKQGDRLPKLRATLSDANGAVDLTGGSVAVWWRPAELAVVDLVLNGGFTADAASWTAIGGATLASVASGQSGNALRITNVSSTEGGAYQSIATVIGQRYLLTYYFKKGTGVSAKIFVESVLNAADLHASAALTDAAWTKRTVEFVAISATTIVRMLSDSAVTGETCYWDTINLVVQGNHGACTLVDAANGIVEYAWAAGDTDVAGVYVLEFVATLAGKTITFPNDGFLTLEILGDIDATE